MEGEGEWKEKGKGRMDGRVVEDIRVLIAERHHSYPFLVMSPSCSRHMVSQSINQSIKQASSARLVGNVRCISCGCAYL